MRGPRAFLLVLTFVCITPFFASAGVDTAPWPMYQHDFSQNGSTSFPGPGVLSRQLLKTPVSGAASSPVVGYGRRIYVGSTNKNIYQVPLNGDPPVAIYQTGNSVYSTPAVAAENRLYVGSDDGYLYAINPVTRSLVWKKLLGTQVRSSPVITSDDRIFVAASDGPSAGTLFCLNAAGTVLWQQTVWGIDYQSPAIDRSGNVYISSGDAMNGYKLSVFSKSGVLIDEAVLDYFWEMTSPPVIGADGTTVYFTALDTSFFAYDFSEMASWQLSCLKAYFLNSRNQLTEAWSHYPRYPVPANLRWAVNLVGSVAFDLDGMADIIPTIFLSAPAVGNDGYLYIGDIAGALYCIDPVDGSRVRGVPVVSMESILMERVLPDIVGFFEALFTDLVAALGYLTPITVPPVIDGGNVSGDGSVYRVYVRTGNDLHAFGNDLRRTGQKYKIGPAPEDGFEPLSGLAIGGNRVVYAVSSEGDLYGIGASNADLQISGTVSGDPGVTDIEVVLSGTSVGSATIDSGGTYTFDQLIPGGTYYVVPCKNGVTFNPPSAELSNLRFNAVQDFTIGDAFSPPEVEAEITPPFLVPDGTTPVNIGASITSPGDGTVTSVTADLRSVGGGIQGMSGTARIVSARSAAGDSYSINYTVPEGTPPGLKEIVITITDSNGLTVQQVITLDIVSEIYEVVSGAKVEYVRNNFEGQTLILTYSSAGGDLILDVYEPSDNSTRPDYASAPDYTFTMTGSEDVGFIYNAAAGIWKYEITFPGAARTAGSSRAASRSASISTSTAGTGVLFGKVLAGSDGSGVVDADVSTTTGGGTVSNTGGIYTFQTSAGSFTVRAQKTGYHSASKSVDLYTGEVKEVNLVMYDGSARIDESSTCFLQDLLGLRSVKLTLLRSFRDSVLSRSLAGHDYINTYYRFSPELAEMVRTDAVLDREIREIVEMLMPNVIRAIFGFSSDLNEMQKARVVDCLEKIRESADSELAAEIERLLNDISNGNLMEGLVP